MGGGGRDGKGKSGKGGKGFKPALITWQVEWHFDRCGQVITDRGLPEHEVVGSALERFFSNTCPWGPTRHLLLPYFDVGVDKLEVFLLHAPRAAVAEQMAIDQMRRSAEHTAETEFAQGQQERIEDGEERVGSGTASKNETPCTQFKKLDKARSLRE